MALQWRKLLCWVKRKCLLFGFSFRELPLILVMLRNALSMNPCGSLAKKRRSWMEKPQFRTCRREYSVIAWTNMTCMLSFIHSVFFNFPFNHPKQRSSYQISLSAFVWNSPRWSVGKISFWAKREREREEDWFSIDQHHHVHLDARGAWRTPVGNDTIWIIEYFFKLNQLRIIALSRAWRYARDRLLYSRAIWIILMHFLGNFFFDFCFDLQGLMLPKKRNSHENEIETSTHMLDEDEQAENPDLAKSISFSSQHGLIFFCRFKLSWKNREIHDRLANFYTFYFLCPKMRQL